MGRQELLTDAQIEEKCRDWFYFEDVFKLGTYDNLFRSIATKCDGRQAGSYWDYRKLVPTMQRDKFDMCYIEICRRKDKSPKKGKPGTRKASKLSVKTVDWLWYPYIPREKLTIIAGPAGTGKTFLTAYLAALVSTGRPFPGEDEGRKPGDVLVINGEDGAEDTILPRLIAAGANLDRIHIAESKLDEEQILFTSDFVEEWIDRSRPALVVFDPFQAFLGSSVDVNRSNETRPVLAHLLKMAEEYKTSILIVMHLSKMSNASFMARVLGSVDISAAARSVIGICPHPVLSDDKVFSHEKSNLAPAGTSYIYQIMDNAVVFGDPVELKADDCLQKVRRQKDSKKQQAAGIISRILSEEHPGEWIESGKIYNTAAELGISKRTVRDAAEDLCIKRKREGFGGTCFWMMEEAL